MTDSMELWNLAEVRHWLEDEVASSGKTRCPCCNQWATVFHGRITPIIARGFLTAYANYGHEWFHWWRATGVNGGDHAKLEHWDLMQPASRHRDPKEPGVGFWRITEHGAAFARGIVRVPKFLYLFRGRLLRVDEKSGTVSIRDVLGDGGFDYDSIWPS